MIVGEDEVGRDQVRMSDDVFRRVAKGVDALRNTLAVRDGRLQEGARVRGPKCRIQCAALSSVRSYLMVVWRVWVAEQFSFILSK